eukprot:GILK01003662.1.p1 GENE.GILK01003662.1~~GILK01003662.1.p1  ORF type:complete len:310 (+),score=38.56 GILK01003662.1:72-1001(+)
MSTGRKRVRTAEIEEEVNTSQRVLRRRLDPAVATKNQEASSRVLAQSVLLAHVWSPTMDPRGWWMSEKLDGVRAFWTGSELLTRQGNRIHAPDFFIAKFPRCQLDGELFLGRGEFQKCVSIVRTQLRTDDLDARWKQLTYVCFDIPSERSSFERRLQALQKAVQESGTQYLKALDQTVCQGADHLQTELLRVEALGGEGLMLREPRSRYMNGRSNTLLKVKRFLDAEAVVIGHEEGNGRNEGRMGALRVRGAKGMKFKIGTGFTDAERNHPPAVGTVVSYKYQELTVAGVPRFPAFIRVRPDVSAKAVV